MSGGIQLSSEMISELKSVIVNSDPAADNDLYFMQYLTAITGYVLAHQDQPGSNFTLTIIIWETIPVA